MIKGQLQYPRRQIRNARRQVCILTYGERDLGFAKSEAKFVLNNMEGTGEHLKPAIEVAE